ncbi:hypothetical protein, partial [Sulfurimonas crateris]|uniref:hypothetical protein n=1 Tax=Sulfurimonas crateris TaxID=2574727 RepID=UPI001CB754F1
FPSGTMGTRKHLKKTFCYATLCKPNSTLKSVAFTSGTMLFFTRSHAPAWECVFQVILQYAFPSRTMEMRKKWRFIHRGVVSGV